MHAAAEAAWLDNLRGGKIFIYACSTLVASIQINCGYGLTKIKVYEYMNIAPPSYRACAVSELWKSMLKERRQKFEFGLISRRITTCVHGSLSMSTMGNLEIIRRIERINQHSLTRFL